MSETRQPADALDATRIDPRQQLAAHLRRLLRDHEHRIGRQVSRSRLARWLNVSQQSVYAYLDGTTLPAPTVLDRLLAELGASQDEIRQAVDARHLVEEQRRLRRRATTGAPATDRPRQLPADVRAFTGRHAEQRQLDRLIGDGDGDGVMPIAAVIGPAGIGKTALAIHWAQRNRGRFPDGQLYVDLHGYAPGRPLPAITALTGFLRTLGVPDIRVPHELDECVALFRTRMAGLRILVLLDNARDTDHVRPLLPGSASCAVLVTSRDRLRGLVARDGAQRLDLDGLPLDDATELLRTLVGPRVSADPTSAHTLALRCARAPLALRVAAELIASRPRVRLDQLADELADERRRLDLLDPPGEERGGLRAVFSWSYRQLPAPAARLFRLLGTQPSHTVDTAAAAALAGVDTDAAERLLALLTGAHLTIEPEPGMVGLHDLLRAYAGGLAAEHDSESDRAAALDQLYDHYLRAAATAMDIAFPADHDTRPVLPTATSPAPATPAEARRWLRRHRANLLTIAEHTAGAGPSHYTLTLAGILWRDLATSGHYAEAARLAEHAIATARANGDRAAEAAMLSSLGSASMHHNPGVAAGHLQRALDLAIETGQPAVQARALANLGFTQWQTGDYPAATRYLREALTVNSVVGSRALQAYILVGLGGSLVRQGAHDEAIDHYHQALAIHTETGNRVGEANATANIAVAMERLGRPKDALAWSRRSLPLCRETGDRQDEAVVLDVLGLVHRRSGRLREAIDYHHRALLIHQDSGDRNLEADALNNLGTTMLAAGRADDAVAAHSSALTCASEARDLHQQLRAHAGLEAARRTTPEARPGG